MDNKIVDQLFKQFKRSEDSVARYNFRGVGRSTGSFDNGRGELRDLEAVVNFCFQSKVLLKSTKLHLIGYSFGAWIVWEYLCRHTSRVASASLIAPPIGMYPFTQLSDSETPTLRIYLAGDDELIDHADQLKWARGLKNKVDIIYSEPEADHYFIGSTKRLIVKIGADLNA